MDGESQANPAPDPSVLALLCFAPLSALLCSSLSLRFCFCWPLTALCCPLSAAPAPLLSFCSLSFHPLFLSVAHHQFLSVFLCQRTGRDSPFPARPACLQPTGGVHYKPPHSQQPAPPAAMAKEEVPAPARVVASTLNAATDAVGSLFSLTPKFPCGPGCVSAGLAAVGAEDREATRMEKNENWGRVEEGDTLWSLSAKYLGESRKWRHLQTACRKELGSDPLMLIPGSHVTKACVAQAQRLSREDDEGVPKRKKWLFRK